MEIRNYKIKLMKNVYIVILLQFLVCYDIRGEFLYGKNTQSTLCSAQCEALCMDRVVSWCFIYCPYILYLWALNCNVILTHQFKHMFRALKRTDSLERFFWVHVPMAYIWLRNKKIIFYQALLSDHYFYYYYHYHYYLSSCSCRSNNVGDAVVVDVVVAVIDSYIVIVKFANSYTWGVPLPKLQGGEGGGGG